MIVFAFALMAAIPAVAGEFRLIMFERDGCIYCEQWHAEIGPAYPNTVEAEIAPLTLLDIDEELPEDIELARRAHLTPTFVLLDAGVEVGRIEGYPGDNFFWFLLDDMILQAGGAIPDT